MKFLGVLFPLLLIYVSFCDARVAFGLLASSNTLIKFNSNAPTQIINSVAITGLADGEIVHGIDIRPSNGKVYGVTSSSRVVIINTITGAASSPVPLLSSCTTPATAGTTYGIDFNAAVDLLRIISSSTGANYAVNVDSGVCTAQTAITGATVVQVAYTNSFRGSTTTQSFVITSAGQLGLIAAPAGGVVGSLLSLGQTLAGVNVGFDIVGASNLVLAAYTVGTTTQLYSINTGTGVATLTGTIGSGASALKSMAVSFTDLDKTVVGINNDGNFFRLESEDPSSVVIAAITGVAIGEFLIGFDFRPANGVLYGISNNSVLYTINPLSYVATAIAPKLANCAITGQYFSVDFNPQADRLRVITDSGVNLRIDVTAFTCTVDTSISGANSPLLASAAYTNNVAGATTTSLFGLDYSNDLLVTFANPNTGAVTTVGALGQNIDAAAGFDIFTTASVNTAVAVVALAGVPNFVTIDLTTGAIAFIATSGSVVCRSLSVAFNRLPYIPATIGAYPNVALLTNESPQRVIIVNSANPGTPLVTPISVTGLDAGTTLLGMDLRPNGSAIVGLGSNSKLYTVLSTTGIAYPGFTLNCSSSVTASDTYSFDFNPVADRLRIVSKTGINLRVNVDNGACFVDGTLAFTSAIPQAVGVAYTNSVSGATSTAEFIIDASVAGGNFAQVTAPNVGTSSIIGALGLSAAISGSAPLDIITFGTTNYAFTVINGVLYDVNIVTGALRAYGSLSVASNVVIGLTVVPIGYVPPAPPASVTTTTGLTGTTGGINTTTTAGATTGGVSNTIGTSTTSSAVAVVAPFMMLLAAIVSLLL